MPEISSRDARHLSPPTRAGYDLHAPFPWAHAPGYTLPPLRGWQTMDRTTVMWLGDQGSPDTTDDLKLTSVANVRVRRGNQ